MAVIYLLYKIHNKNSHSFKFKVDLYIIKSVFKFILISISNLEMKLMNINRYGEAGVSFQKNPALPCDSREPNSFAGFSEN